MMKALVQKGLWMNVISLIPAQHIEKAKEKSVSELPGLSTTKAPVELDPSTPVHLILTETDTHVLFDLPSICVFAESSEEVTMVKASNAKYKELKQIHQNNDNYVNRSMQTYREPLKNKDVQATLQKFAHAECNTTQWDIYDAYHETEKRKQEGESVREADLSTMQVVMASSNSTRLGENSAAGSRSIDHSSSVFTTDDESHSVLNSGVNIGRAQDASSAQVALAKDEVEKDTLASVLSFMIDSIRSLTGSFGTC
ncbi:hypothetical protein EDD86DRAFT_94080 [Gorgonomyces haynaldii]|nr:hypothetical protein EDD86DRAFT_94080 [Gorgonomyces haynaldii]